MINNTSKLTRVAAIAMAAGLVFSACSSDKKDVDASDSEAPTESPAADEIAVMCEERGALGGGGEEAGSADALEEVTERGEPTVEPIADPSGEVEVTELIEGQGDPVIAGGAVEIHFVLAVAKTGEEIEKTWAAGQTTTVNLDEFPPALVEAVDEMKVGGRTMVVLKASEVGAGSPTDQNFTPEDSLIFVVDLVSVSEAAASPTDAETDEEALKAANDRGEPEIVVPEEGPTELVIEDDVIGSGELVCPGDTVVAHYKGVDLSSGEEFDSSWSGGEPIAFPLDGVIEGWTEGIPGMYVGGRRTLVIPAEQAYGESDEDSPGQPSGDLVFTVDLVGVG